jgi:lysine 2,3-aminomutase
MIEQFVTRKEDLKSYIELSSKEEDFFNSSGESLPLKVSLSWLKRMEGLDDPLRKQAIPRVDEYIRGANELDDPIGDMRHSPLKGLIHHYNDRVLVLITDKCAMFCRHCFRRHFTGRGGDLNREQIDLILEYIKDHREVHEVIISGGDSLMAPYETISYLLDGLKKIDRPLVKRMGTRMPSVAPEAVSPRILDLLEEEDSLWMVLQVNHIKEMTPEFGKLIKSIRKRGIPLLNQAVLLKGVNDTLEDQKNLCYSLIEHGIKPYYLFQGDMARGTAHFRVPLDRAMELYGSLTRTVSHMALPRFGLDLPGGGGKVGLEESYFEKKDEKYYYFRNKRGEVGAYPREKE